MNKRLIELAQQATGQFLDLPGECPTVMDPTEFEKFAELIVREYIAMSVGANQYKLGFQLAKEVKQHFGVE